jgi:hypothetical protein
MNENLPSICAESSGVPILLCPVENAHYWEGIHVLSNGRVVETEFGLNGPDGPHVDYDRACDAASEYVNTIQIGPSQALLFGDDIPFLLWLASETFIGGYALIWLWGEQPDYQSQINSLPQIVFTDTGHVINCSDQGLLLFPSTQAPMDGNYFESIKINCPAGIYGAAIGFYETADTHLRIIKIQRQE